MARIAPDRNLTPVLTAAEQWQNNCLIKDNSLFLEDHRWTTALVDELYQAFVNHPDTGDDDFMTKLRGQMKRASPAARQLMAEMLWALLLFPSNIKPEKKRQQIHEIWELSGKYLPNDHSFLSDEVLAGIGSGGPGFNNYRPDELRFLIELTRDLKIRPESNRREILGNYRKFIEWIAQVPQKGSRQFRHMFRYFLFPDRVERISSNNDRQKILAAFGQEEALEGQWTDWQIDEALAVLRASLQKTYPTETLDFYTPPLREQWSRDRKIKTASGEITVTIPDDKSEEEENIVTKNSPADVRESIQIQSILAKTGASMGFKIWIPRSDRVRVRALVPERQHEAFLEVLPLSYEKNTFDVIEQIDVLWIKGRAIQRAFEVEHTTSVYSGLLRMADLLALQPNMDIKLHIVAPDERRDKVFKEIGRPIFSLLDRGPLSRSCTYVSYDNVRKLSNLEHLTYLNDAIISEYEERSDLV